MQNSKSKRQTSKQIPISKLPQLGLGILDLFWILKFEV